MYRNKKTFSNRSAPGPLSALKYLLQMPTEYSNKIASKLPDSEEHKNCYTGLIYIYLLDVIIINSSFYVDI